MGALGRMLAPARFDGNRHRALLRAQGLAPLLAFTRALKTDA